MANRLANATSAYLLQHAANPVDWWEWGPEAFEEARRRDTPILLSVGYAACHWCHVMVHESFEDEQTATYLNEHFVAVKVDREERPDVDAVYMQATVAMTGQGGWPMTCMLDHEGAPFFAGTYFPDRPRQGMPSFRQLLEAVTDAWTQRRDEVAGSAERIREHLNREAALQPGTVDAGVLDAAVRSLAEDFDARNGGFGTAPKFPPSMVLEFLLRHHQRTGSPDALEMVERTCEAMARGGMYDQLGGGFARYSVDAGWVVPHFEKMLYDNAQLLSVYAGWYAVTGSALAERVVRETAAFLLHELGVNLPSDQPVPTLLGLASSIDADSGGEEGSFYVWTPQQLVEALGPEDGRWAAGLLGVTDCGTFERGASTLQLRDDPDDPDKWESVRRRLLEARADRTRPERDDKVVAAWNGLAISALVRAGEVLDEGAYIRAARMIAGMLREVHWVGTPLRPRSGEMDGTDDADASWSSGGVQGELRRASRDGVAGQSPGVLEDYACVAGGLLSLAEADGDPYALREAGGLLEKALAHFAADDGGFFDTADDAESLVTRPRDPSDNASPSGLSAMVHALARYAALTGSSRHRETAERALASVHALAERAPRFAGWSLAAAESMLDGPAEVVVVSEAQEDDPLFRTARRVLGAVVLVVTPEHVEEFADRIPLLADRTLVEGRAAAYVCRNLVCQQPVTEPDDLAAQLGGRM